MTILISEDEREKERVVFMLVKVTSSIHSHVGNVTMKKTDPSLKVTKAYGSVLMKKGLEVF